MPHRRYGLLAACIATVGLCTMSIAAATATTTMHAPGYCGIEATAKTGSFESGGHVVMLVSAFDYVSDFGMLGVPAPAAIRPRSSHAACGSSAVWPTKVIQRPGSAAVQPTSVAGWRSGRVRRLAG